MFEYEKKKSEESERGYMDYINTHTVVTHPHDTYTIYVMDTIVLYVMLQHKVSIQIRITKYNAEI